MAILVIAENNDEKIYASTYNTATAALEIGGDIDLLMLGKNISGDCLAEAAKISGVRKVLNASNDVYADLLPEDISSLVSSIADGYTHILAPANTFGKDFMPRLAAILGVSQISDIVQAKSEDSFVRPIYAGNVLATVKSSDAIKIITVRTTSFDKAQSDGTAVVENIDALASSGLSELVELLSSQSDRPDLSSASIVVSGGRGLGSAEKFQEVLGPLADKLGAAMGASRVAVDSGYVPNDMQVGQTGKIIAPDLYIAVGISGAIQHLAGMKESKVIVAINKDENAPIFEIADYGLVADLFEAVPEMERLL